MDSSDRPFSPAGEGGGFPAESSWIKVAFIGQVLSLRGDELKFRVNPSDPGTVGYGIVTIDRKAWREAEAWSAFEPVHFRNGDLYRINLSSGDQAFIVRTGPDSWHSASNGAETRYRDAEIAAAIRNRGAVKLEEAKR